MDQKDIASERDPSHHHQPQNEADDLSDYESLANQSRALVRSNYSGLPSRPFPSVMRVRGEFRRAKTLLLSDASTGQDVFCIEVHTGYSGSQPLGFRRGVVLHDGISKRDAVLAAAGDVAVLGVFVTQLSRSCLVYLPPVEPGKNFISFDTARMEGAYSPLYQVVFSFYLDAGEKPYRERFEWRKFKDDGLGGFRLVRLCSRRRRLDSTSSKPSTNKSSSTPSFPTTPLQSDLRDDSDGEVIAVLRWRRFWSGITLDGYFELELVGGSTSSGEMGQRLAVMVVITAARLWSIRLRGRTTETYNKVADSL